MYLPIAIMPRCFVWLWVAKWLYGLRAVCTTVDKSWSRIKEFLDQANY